MRIMIKGGVWKNTEDEILKAAVMKYGKNQWARISSLLVRKSAKQCKARWYEWLDPSIKKTEWTREEDEKLLHLAKLMPTQWRTIAPIVGRTPSQCLERYEKLLDAACVKDENYEPGDDPRKLRPGEIDPNPESKPARPDPVDMDEDEKEMLSEARARLANTKGKKAKRKAREKQLEEARRLASLQKKRELKAAGIDMRQRKRKRKGIDYNAEIPFEKRPPPGFFDVSDEDRPVEQPQFPTTIEELEGKRRVDVEAQLRKQDIAKNKIAQRQDAPSAILHANKLNDPETVRKRSKLMLPPPQISDQELDEIAKLGYASDLAGSQELAEGSGATRALLADYAQTPGQGMTPLRTPQRTPAGKGDAIMMEAENLARLRESQTPLLGGENPELHPSDFNGVTPKKKEIQTPNPMLTPATPGGAGLTPRIGMTPTRDGFSFSMTPKGTPLRDALHINEDMNMHDSTKLELQRQADVRRSLHSGLGSLPQPKNEYQIVMQPVPEDAEEPEEKIEEDMSDRIAREKAEEEARQQALLRKRSKVLQRELPRPPTASLELIRNSLMRTDGDKSSFVPPTSIEQADEMIRRELLTLLEHDNAKYPLDEKVIKEKKKGAKRAVNGSAVPVIEDFQEDEMKEADKLIKEEALYLCAAMGHEDEPLDEFIEAHRTCLNDLMYFPTRNAYGLSSVAGNMEKLAALQNEFENVRNKLDDDKEKMVRLEKKVMVLTQGYEWEALALLLIGISVNQLRSLPEGTTALGLPVTMGAYAYTLIFVTVPSLASVYNEYALKSQYDTSIYLQNLFLYGYGAIFNFLGILGTVVVKGPSSFDILQGHSKATMLLIANNAAQGILSSFFFKYADTILKKYSSTVATIFTGIASAVLFGHTLTMNFVIGISIVFISMHQFFSPLSKVKDEQNGVLELHDVHDKQRSKESFINMAAGANEEATHRVGHDERQPLLPS